MALAAVLSVVVALFNLYVSWPLGIPPEFVLFMALAVIFISLWWTIRRNLTGRRRTKDEDRKPNVDDNTPNPQSGLQQ